MRVLLIAVISIMLYYSGLAQYKVGSNAFEKNIIANTNYNVNDQGLLVINDEINHIQHLRRNSSSVFSLKLDSVYLMTKQGYINIRYPRTRMNSVRYSSSL